jgi:hypothetical protein
MKRVLMTAIAFAFSAGVAFAADPMDVYIGNTLKAVSPDGTTTKIWYKADKTYTGANDKGAKMSGTWEVSGGQLCTIQKEPAPPAGQEKRCGDLGNRKVGDSWEDALPNGGKMTLSIVAGS